MNKKLLILLLIIISIIGLSFCIIYDRFSGKYFWTALFVPILVFILPAFLIAIVFCSIFTRFHSKLLTVSIWTNFAGLLIIVSLLGWNYLDNWLYDKYEANIKNNDSYRKMFGALASQAIDAIEEKQTARYAYGIYSMEVTNRDTIYKNELTPYIVVDQIYFVGKKKSIDNLFVSKHVIYPDETIKEIFDVPLKPDSTTAWQRYKMIERAMQELRDSSTSSE